MIVLKFGDGSLKDADSFAKVMAIIGDLYANQPEIVVVLAAAHGVAKSLLRIARDCSLGEEIDLDNEIATIRNRHREIVKALIPAGTPSANLKNEIDSLLSDYQKLCYACSVLGQTPARIINQVRKIGPQLASRIVAAALWERGIQTRYVDASECIVAKMENGVATPDLQATCRKSTYIIQPLLERRIIAVVPGSYGTTLDGWITNLGRGGSDLTAALLGNCLDCEEIWYWTDSDGVKTADSDIVPDTRTIERLSFAEATEMNYFGSHLLYPQTLLPLIPKKIPLRIKNTFRPQQPGTLISEESEHDTRPIRAISSVADVSMITINGRGMIGVPGIAAKIFTSVSESGANILLISQSASENNICFVVKKDEVNQVVAQLEADLVPEFYRQQIDKITVISSVAIVACIGSGMAGRPGVAAEVFSVTARNGINVRAIAQTSTELNISFLIDRNALPKALRAIHKSFQLDLPNGRVK